MRRLFILIVMAGLLAGCASIGSSSHSNSSNFLVVHGAWGGGWAFREVEDLLRADGHRVHRPTLTGQGEKSHLATSEVNLSLHIQDIVNVMEWDDMREVVLVGHSYGGMVVTGAADRVPQRIKCLVYLDAFVPEEGESVDTLRAASTTAPLRTTPQGGFLMPTWLRPGTPIPHDVPMPAKCFSEPISLKNQAAARKIPTVYILTVDKGKQPNEDTFYQSYQRAKSRGWKAIIMVGDHNVQWSNPKGLVKLLEDAGDEPMPLTQWERGG